VLIEYKGWINFSMVMLFGKMWWMILECLGAYLMGWTKMDKPSCFLWG